MVGFSVKCLPVKFASLHCKCLVYKSKLAIANSFCKYVKPM